MRFLALLKKKKKQPKINEYQETTKWLVLQMVHAQGAAGPAGSKPRGP